MAIIRCDYPDTFQFLWRGGVPADPDAADGLPGLVLHGPYTVRRHLHVSVRRCTLVPALTCRIKDVTVESAGQCPA